MISSCALPAIALLTCFLIQGAGMARGSDDKKVILTENQDNLRRIDGRLNSLRCSHPTSSEVARFEFIRQDVASRMDEAEMAGYIKAMTAELTPAEKKAQAERDRKAMEENRDKPSI